MSLKITLKGIDYPVEAGDDFMFTATVGDWVCSGETKARLQKEMEKVLEEMERAGIDFAFQPRKVYDNNGDEILIRGIHQKERKLLITYPNNRKDTSRGEQVYAINDTVKQMLEERAAVRAEMARIDKVLTPWKVEIGYFSSHTSILSHLVALDDAINKAENGASVQ